MLIQFSVGNFLSFKDVATFSMLASTSKEFQDENTYKLDKLRLLKSAVIYGANASGKSNLTKAMDFMGRFVRTSFKEKEVGQKIEVDPFKLSTETDDKPSLFEIVFIYENIKYRYGFEVDKKKVHKEWLFFSPKRKETKLFERNNQEFLLGPSYKEGKNIEEKTREDALFISVVAQFNGSISKKIKDWFDNFRVVSGLEDFVLATFSKEQLRDRDFKDKMIKLIKIADLGIEDVSIKDEKIIFENMSFPKGMPEVFQNYFKEKKETTIDRVTTVHKKYDKDNNYVSTENFDLEDESDGTQKFFAMSAPLIDTLESGYTVVIDEMDSRLHPNLTKFITKLFNSKMNKNNAQLIFVAHDSTLIKKAFRRDQIWFVDKDQYGKSDLYSLLEYRVRKDASFDKDYIVGKYGAVPRLSNPDILFGDSNG